MYILFFLCIQKVLFALEFKYMVFKTCKKIEKFTDFAQNKQFLQKVNLLFQKNKKRD